MGDYKSLLLGGAMKPKRKVTQATLDALAKGRATRAANLKKQKGSGQYNRDYVDESDVFYAGSPLDVYYLGTPKTAAEERAERGEVTGKGRKGKGVEEVLMKPARGGMLMKQKLSKPTARSVEEEDEMEYTGGAMHKPTGASMRTESAKAFLKHQNFSGMDRPTEQQIKTGGKMKKGKKKIHIEDIEGGEVKHMDVPGAIQVLAELASKFGLKLVK